MNLGKEELDAMLRGWPAPAPGKDAPPPKREGKLEAEDDEVWAARAAAVTQKAMSAGAFDNLDALLAPPTLAAEAGEPVGAGEPIKISAGEAKMSDEKDPPEAPASIPAPAMSRRGSLKAMAERASQA